MENGKWKMENGKSRKMQMASGVLRNLFYIFHFPFSIFHLKLFDV